MGAEGLSKSHTVSLRQSSHPVWAATFDKPLDRAGRVLFEGTTMPTVSDMGESAPSWEDLNLGLWFVSPWSRQLNPSCCPEVKEVWGTESSTNKIMGSSGPWM